MDLLQDTNLSKNTKTAYGQGLKHWEQYRKGRDITPELCEGFAKYLDDKGLSSQTQHVYLTGVIRYLDHKSADIPFPEYIEHSHKVAPLRNKRMDLFIPPFKPALPTNDEIEQALKAVEHTERNHERDHLAALRDRAMFKVALCTGLRTSELAHIKLADVNLKRREIKVIAKGNKKGLVVIAPQATEAIKDYLNERKKFDNNQNTPRRQLPLFSRHDKKAGRNILSLSTRSVEMIFNRIGKMGGCRDPLTVHKIRHCVATRMHEKTGDTFMIGHALNHNSLITTKGYTHTPKSVSIEKLKALGDSLLVP